MAGIRLIPVVALLAAMAMLGLPARAQRSGTVDVSVVLDPPHVTQHLEVEIAFYPIELTTTGETRLGPATTGRAAFEPNAAGRQMRLAVKLEAGRQYQVTVDVVDTITGDLLKDKTYYFASTKLLQGGPEERVALSANKGTIVLPLRWEARVRKKANFLDVFPNADGVYEMALYYSDDQVSRLIGL